MTTTADDVWKLLAELVEAQKETESNRQPNLAQKLLRSILLQPHASYLLFLYTRQPKTIRKTLEKVYLDRSAITEQLIEDIRRPSLDAGAAKVFASVFKSPRGENVDILLQKLSCPLLMLWGEGDPWMNTRERGPGQAVAIQRQHVVGDPRREPCRVQRTGQRGLARSAGAGEGDAAAAPAHRRRMQAEHAARSERRHQADAGGGLAGRRIGRWRGAPDPLAVVAPRHGQRAGVEAMVAGVRGQHSHP